MKVFEHYTKFAHGLTAEYDEANRVRDEIAAFVDFDYQGEQQGPILSLAWDDRPHTLDQILRAKRMSRLAFMKTLAFPKPSPIFNLVICAELRKRHDLGNVEGFKGGVFQLPKGDGVMVPEKGFTGLRFVRMSEMVRERESV